MIFSAGNSSFADVPIGSLWEEEMLRWGDNNNHRLAPMFYMAELEVDELRQGVRHPLAELQEPWLAVIQVVPAELAQTSPSWCLTPGHNHARCAPESVTTAPAPSLILAAASAFPSIPELAEAAEEFTTVFDSRSTLGPAIVVLQDAVANLGF
jgi:hypothetical protein